VQAFSRDSDLFRRVPDPDPVVPELAHYHSNEAGVQATQQHLLPPQASLQSKNIMRGIDCRLCYGSNYILCQNALFSVQYLYGLYSYLFVILKIYIKII
jgi:hypothetical protein